MPAKKKQCIGLVPTWLQNFEEEAGYMTDIDKVREKMEAKINERIHDLRYSNAQGKVSNEIAEYAVSLIQPLIEQSENEYGEAFAKSYRETMEELHKVELEEIQNHNSELVDDVIRLEAEKKQLQAKIEDFYCPHPEAGVTVDGCDECPLIEEAKKQERERIREELKPWITQCKCDYDGSNLFLKPFYLRKIFLWWQALKQEEE